jgi:hypothetical protein
MCGSWLPSGGGFSERLKKAEAVSSKQPRATSSCDNEVPCEILSGCRTMGLSCQHSRPEEMGHSESAVLTFGQRAVTANRVEVRAVSKPGDLHEPILEFGAPLRRVRQFERLSVPVPLQTIHGVDDLCSNPPR